MLFDLLFEHKGRTTASRILDASLQRQEITVIGKGKSKELDVSILITYWNKPTPGILMIHRHQDITTAKETG